VVAVAQERKVEFPQFAYVAVRKVGQHRVAFERASDTDQA
jgi:hypothetical protein